MTSGEMIWQEISTSIDNYANNIKNCFHIYNSSREDGLEFRNGLEKFNFVSNINDANFILACTPFENTEPIDYIPILKDALDMNIISRDQFDKLAIAINTGTNIPSVATPNGQAAFLFLLTSSLAPLINLSYMRMVIMALPYTIVLSIVGFISVVTFL